MEEELIALLAGRDGHFLLESGYHGERLFALDSLFARPERLRPFVSELARRLARHGIGAVCGPMSGGAKLAGMIAADLGIEYFFAERFQEPGATGLFPVQYLIPVAGRERVRGRLIAIVDDAVSAGSAVRGTYADLVRCGARPVALGALFLFGDGALRFASDKNLALEGIASRPIALWPPKDCPLCKAGVALESVSDSL